MVGIGATGVVQRVPIFRGVSQYNDPPFSAPCVQQRLNAGGMWRFLTTLSSRMTTMYNGFCAAFDAAHESGACCDVHFVLSTQHSCDEMVQKCARWHV